MPVADVESCNGCCPQWLKGGGWSLGLWDGGMLIEVRYFHDELGLHMVGWFEG